MLTAGIDVGSVSAKCAIIRDGELLGENLLLSGFNSQKAGETVFKELTSSLKILPESIDKIVSTGYGRKNVLIADKSITEITCHAAGAHYLRPDIRFVIDIGGQDSKAIALTEKGKVKDFVMNDKCAAGTGRFLEVMARSLEIELENFGQISLKAENPATISSLCTVFAESEVISLISQGAERGNIIAGLHKSIATRVLTMAKRIGLSPPAMMTGGVAKNVGVVKALEEKSGLEFIITEKAQFTGAIGAAILAADMA